MVKTVIWMSNFPQIASVCSCECAVSEGVDMFPFWPDMFPRTGTISDINQKVSCHVETVVLLSKGAKGPVDLWSARTEAERRQATYEQIKAYVLEQTGLKVSSLYIAQIKKKCGLDVGENFNLTKSENTRQPQCTPEKEDAIMQAFRHFGII